MGKEYILHEENGTKYRFGRDDCLAQKFIEFKGRKILVLQKQNEHCKFVIVPGYIASEVYKTEYGKKAVKCEPIQEQDKKDLSSKFRDAGFEGHINFNE